ncbi:putative xaa-Pro dipeptidase [Helianthus annuus]|nr:putative xaa-Pro dipeptidase [Helianthus annuus]
MHENLYCNKNLIYQHKYSKRVNNCHLPVTNGVNRHGFFINGVAAASSSGGPMKLHAENREKLLKHLREYLNSSSRPLKGFVLLQGGEEQTRYCTDHEDLFRYFSSFALT